MDCLEEIICEAKCCAVDYSSGFVDAITFGNKNDEKYYEYLLLLAYIDVLERNIPTRERVKVIETNIPTKVDFSSLKKENNTLTLATSSTVSCETIITEPCLSDSELCKIVEHIKTFCSTCDCNCN